MSVIELLIGVILFIIVCVLIYMVYKSITGDNSDTATKSKTKNSFPTVSHRPPPLAKIPTPTTKPAISTNDEIVPPVPLPRTLEFSDDITLIKRDNPLHLHDIRVPSPSEDNFSINSMATDNASTNLSENEDFFAYPESKSNKKGSRSKNKRLI